MTEVKIRILDDSTINQIAAGEVIENPASVVKELVENALDAGARSVAVETKAGGRSLIRISDDGHGMSPDDLLIAVERHATSKLSSVDDFDQLKSLGFRGEALPSIASVSKMSIQSAQDQKSGAILRIEGGKLEVVEPSSEKRELL